jgi:uncharacterized membrane protein
MTSQPEHRRERGFTFIIHSIALIGTIGAVGLTVDVGSFYVTKTKLSAAVDGAALAAGRSLNLAGTVSQGPFPQPDPDPSSGNLMISSAREHLRDRLRQA